MKNILSIGRRFSIWMVLLAFLGCSDDDLDGLPQVVSSFTYTVNQDTGTVTFVNVSEGARTYVWDFGDGTTSKEIDPIKTYSDSGTYKVTLVASNQAGASSTFEDELTLNIKQDITLPITFDDTNVIYEASTFDGAAFEIVANPDVSGSNDKETNVGEITNSGAAFEGLFFDLGTPVDLTTDKTITMNFWSEAPIDVLMKLEEGTGAATETSASHGGTGWEEISFDFTSSASYSRLTLFVDGPGTTAGIFYFDDVEQAGTDPGGDDCTAETEQSLDASDFNLTFLTDPGSAIIGDGAAYSYIDNPDTDNDVNPSCKVGQIDRNPGLPFANNQIVFDSKFDFTANTGFKLKVWAPVAGTNVLLKLEDKSNSAVNTEVAAVT
ncbi:MAG: PKD domain-containing protein, partial [Robiginitalea sp.]|uniref:PKD domain-containing protein n=1 Tax=Robiginitalea sp. TaxID=1902411 RepID=UPI003C7217E1